MSYLAELRQVAHKNCSTLPPGALAGKTPFARVYNHLLPLRRMFTSTAFGQSHRYLYDGEELSRGALVGLRLQCAENNILASLEVVRQAAIALAAANRAQDPWRPAIERWLNESTVVAGLGGEGPIVRITIRDAPHLFVAMRDIKLELGAFGAPGTRRVRLAMKSLGWRERRAFAWGRRMLGFSRKIEVSRGREDLPIGMTPPATELP
jgi:hypothetical protein